MPSNASPLPGAQTRAEIQQEPDAIRNTLAQEAKIKEIAGRILAKNPHLIIITGSGTSFHAANSAMYYLHIFAHIPCYCAHPSEIPYFILPILSENVVMITISQSGESGDSVRVSDLVSSHGVAVFPIVNEPESTLARTYPDTVICSRAGKEASVLATKTYISQVALVAAISLEIGMQSGKMPREEYNAKLKELLLIPDKIEIMRDAVQDLSKRIAKSLKFLQKAFVLGTGPDVATALEGSLKLKEGARIVAQGYSAPEFAHGPVTLADRETLIIMLVPVMDDGINDARERIMLKIIDRVKRQGASALVVSSPGDEIPDSVDFKIEIPKCSMEFNPLLAIVPLQYLVLEISLQKGLNPDSPVWLTKVAEI